MQWRTGETLAAIN